MISVQKSVAHPWMCDVLGHLTTRFYVGMFDDAAYHFLHSVFGWIGASDDQGKTAWVDVRHVIEYQNEVTAGELVSRHGGVDVQHLLPYGTVSEIRRAVTEAKELFGCAGGIVLGPSHEITPDTPVENILAIYSTGSA